MSSNTDRMRAELLNATESLPEKFPGYHEELVQAAIECITDTAEHGGRRLNINQRFEATIENLAQQIATAREGRNDPI